MENEYNDNGSVEHILHEIQLLASRPKLDNLDCFDYTVTLSLSACVFVQKINNLRLSTIS